MASAPRRRFDGCIKMNQSEKGQKKGKGFLVAISSSPYSPYLIEWTNRVAAEQGAPWLAVYIQTGRDLSREENDLLRANMKLVGDLGTDLIISMDEDVSRGIMRVAREHVVSHVVVGKPLGYKPAGVLKRTDIIKSLIRESGEIDIFIVSERDIAAAGRGRKLVERVREIDRGEFLHVTFWLFVLVGVNFLLSLFINYLSVGFIFLAAVSVVSMFYRRMPVLYFASLSAIIWNFLFIEPRFTLYIARLEDLLMFLMYFITALIVGNLATRLRLKEVFLRKREKNLEALYLMGKVVNESNSREEIIEKSVRLLHVIFSVHTAVFLKEEGDVAGAVPRVDHDFKFSDVEREALQWSLDNGRPSGKNTDMLNGSRYSFIPLSGSAISPGVLAVDDEGKNNLTADQETLLYAMVSQMTTALERIEYSKTQQKIKLAEESERIYQLLLNSVSHELRTPITTISTSASGLIDETLGGNGDVREILANDIIESSERLNRIVDNLLGSLRIESGYLTLNLEWYDVSELVSYVHKKLKKLMGDHSFVVNIGEDIPMLKFDFMLMDQLLSNLIYNAVLYTPAGSMIELDVSAENAITVMRVKDNGPGIPFADRADVFNRFYRGKDVKTGGLGLGLPICREIAELHGGTIALETNEHNGASFVVRMPLQQSEISGELDE